MHRYFLDFYGLAEDFQTFKDWRQISIQSFTDGGLALLNIYGSSPQRLISSCYSEYNFSPWEGLSAPRQTWSSLPNVRHRVDVAARELKINRFDDFQLHSSRLVASVIKGGAHFLIPCVL